MPFKYFGSKHGLSRHYPPPQFGTVIEPFAGAAGYSVFHATPAHRVMLFDKDPRIVTLWESLITDAPGVVAECDEQMRNGAALHPILTLMRGGTMQEATERSQIVTEWLVKEWRLTRKRIIRIAPLMGQWSVTEADYRDISNQRGVWFVDPPYKPFKTNAGLEYRHGAAGIDYEELAAWSRDRLGQVIVCEQEPADWLPFRPLARQLTTSTGASDPAMRRRTEVMWSKTPNINTNRSKALTARAKARRQA